MDSIRRSLRAQLERHNRLRPGFPPSEDDLDALFAMRRAVERRRA